MTLVENLHQARKDRLARMSANAVEDIGIDLKRKKVCGTIPQIPEKSNRQLIEELRAQVSSLQTQLTAHFHLNPQPVFIQPNEATPLERPTMEKIKRLVANHYGITVQDLESHVKFGAVANARHVAVYLCRRLTVHSLPRIGKVFGDRDHTTVLNSYRRVIERRDRDEAFAASVATLMFQLDPTGQLAA